MPSRKFSVTWDYRCPFARNAHEHVVAGLLAGAGWDVEFTPFSLLQVHVEEGAPAVWDDPGKRPKLLAPLAGIVVRDRFPEAFLGVHLGLFEARHDGSKKLEDQVEVRRVLTDNGADADKVMAQIEDGWPLEVLRETHEMLVSDYSVFGVPTFIAGKKAAFVRLMTRPDGDGQLARDTIERVLGLLEDDPDINELKHTTIDR